MNTEGMKESEIKLPELPRGHRFTGPDGRLIMDAETLRYLEGFGALYWSTDDIAEYLGVEDFKWWQAEVGNPHSQISRAIRHGELEQRANVELGILKGAIGGNDKDVETYRTMMRDKSFALSKLDLFGGTRDMNLWAKIQDYIAGGSKGTLSTREQRYIDLLNLIFSLDRQYGKRKTVKFLTSAPFGYTYSQASNLYSEAVELFYCNRNVSRKALREKTADMFDALYQAAVQSAKTTADYLAAADILTRKAKMLRLDEEDPEKLDPGMYERRPVVLSLDSEDIGLPKADRRRLAELIDRTKIPQSEKKRLEMEAGIVDMDIVKVLENESQEAGQH